MDRQVKLQNLYHGMWNKKIPQLLFYVGLTIELGMVIIDKSNYLNPIEGQLFRITFLLFALKLLLTEYTWQEWGLIVFMEAIGVISYRITGKNDIIRIVTFVMACKGIPLKQMLRYTFCVTLAGCTAIILLSVTGIYGVMSLTMDFGRGYEQTRYTLGMGHPNALACMFLMLVALGIYVFSERMKWYIYLFLMLLNVGMYYLTDSKTSMLVTSLLLIASFIMTYVKFLREKSVAYICGFLLFVLCLGFSLDGAIQAKAVRGAYYYAGLQSEAVRDVYRDVGFFGTQYDSAHIRALMHLDRRLNGRILSLTDSDRDDGAVETWSLFSEPDNMTYYFDMGWVKVFYRYGIIPGILYCLACLWLLWRLYRNRDAFGMLVFVMLAVYTVMEAHLISVYLGRNFLLMMMGYYLTSVNTEQGSLINQP